MGTSTTDQKKRLSDDDDDNDDEAKKLHKKLRKEKKKKSRENGTRVDKEEKPQKKKDRKEKKKKDKKRRREDDPENTADESKNIEANQKKKRGCNDGGDGGCYHSSPIDNETEKLSNSTDYHHNSNNKNNNSRRPPLEFDYKYILAPMVGASELPFRLLCRKYGTQLAYTPMMSASRFVREPAYRDECFQTNGHDRPLVCHFGVNTPEDFAQAVRLVHGRCDAVDLNLGCPQRTAYVGHFGSYLLDPPDRQLILDIVKAGSQAMNHRGTDEKSKPMPIFVKIRLLDTLDKTIELCRQLRDAGASLIAIHARYRAGWERKGPGARDGPALLDQVTKIKKEVSGVAIIANGNVISYDDVVTNLQLTRADGIMSAEGILDNPALFLPRLGSNDEVDDDSGKTVSIVDPLLLCENDKARLKQGLKSSSTNDDDNLNKKKRKLFKKLREIDRIQSKIDKEGDTTINDEQRQKLTARSGIEASLKSLEDEETKHKSTLVNGSNEPADSSASNRATTPDASTTTTTNKTVTATAIIPLSKLYQTANDKIALAKEYMTLAEHFGPTSMRTKIFHVRRMLRDTLNSYQFMEECLQCTDHTQLLQVIQQCQNYRDNPELFVYDREKAKKEKEALERKRHEEGKRKAFEARMIRKAKREGKSKDDLDYYLRLGATVPTRATIARFKSLDKKQQLEEWKKKDHSQHCLAFHLEGCKRGRGCAFLHVDAIDSNNSAGGGQTNNTTFEEQDEVAG